MSIIIKALQLAHRKLGRDVAKHDARIEKSEEEIETAGIVYQAQVEVAQAEYQDALAKAARIRDYSLRDANDQLNEKISKHDARIRDSRVARKPLNTLHRKLGQALETHDKQETQLASE